MLCETNFELQRAYDAALRAWALYRFPSKSVFTRINEGPQLMEEEVLSARKAAASSLHLHRQSCLICKAPRQAR
jgi:hypothetical protein